jgi:hypothetical protein
MTYVVSRKVPFESVIICSRLSELPCSFSIDRCCKDKRIVMNTVMVRSRPKSAHAKGLKGR